jgi:hypothetical protein
MDFMMAYGPPASHNQNYVHSWLRDTVEAHQLLMDKIVCVAMTDIGHVAFRLMIMYAVRRYGFLLRTLPLDICRPYLGALERAIRIAVYRILGDSQDVQTLLDKLMNCAKRRLSLPSEFGGLNVPSLELDAELAHYVSFTATVANLITDYKSESLGLIYGLVRHE